MRLTARVATLRILKGSGPLLFVLCSLVPNAFAASVAEKREVTTVGSTPLQLTPTEIAKAEGKLIPSLAPNTDVPPITSGACSFTMLISGVAQTVSVDKNFPFTQVHPYWSAVGVRPASTDDWDLTVNDAVGADPVCVSGQLAASVEGTGVVDFIVGDFNHTTQKTYYAHAYPFAGIRPATIEWDNGPDQLVVNGFGAYRTTTSNDVLECFDVFLEAGKTYSITLGATGQASMKLYFFRNPASSPYWVNLNQALFSQPAAPGGLTGNYNALANDWYGIVVVNENGEPGEYNLRVNTCEPSVAIASGVTQLVTGNPSPLNFTPSAIFWAAAAVRASGPAQDWDLSLWQDYAAGASFPCWTSEYATSRMGFGKADVVAVDFNFSPLGSVFAQPFPVGPTNTSGLVEWDGGADQLGVGTPVTRPTGPGDIVHMWDVLLTGGHIYRVEISSQSTALGTVTSGEAAPECTALLFRNHNGSAPYAAGRQNADLQTSTVGAYAAPSGGWYGVAVVNDNGATGEYTVKVSEESVVDVTPPGVVAFVTRLVSLSPNPAAAGAATRIEFELATSARVGFDLVDVGGRVARRLEPVSYGAGPASTTWALRSDAPGSSRGAAGVYFLRMTVDGRAVGTKRVVLLAGGAQ